MSYPFMTLIEELVIAAGTLTTDLNTGHLHLFTAASAPPSQASLIGDFTEATYAGYAAAAVAAWSAPFRDVNGSAALAMPSQNFAGPGDLTGQTILGAYYTSSAGGALIWAALFDNPVPLMDALGLLVVNAQVNVPGSGWISTEGSILP